MGGVAKSERRTSQYCDLSLTSSMAPSSTTNVDIASPTSARAFAEGRSLRHASTLELSRRTCHNGEMDKQFSGLELCRFFAAFGVVVWHYQQFFVHGIWFDNAINSTDRQAFPLYFMFAPFYQHGFIAVQIFWVISGFIFVWKYGKDVHEKRVGPRRFFILRFSRLYPLHFVTLLLVAALQPIYRATHSGNSFIYGPDTVNAFALQLGFASNWLTYVPETFNGPIWSVSAEILTYAVFFLVARMIRPGFILSLSVVILTKIVMRYIQVPTIECAHYFFAGGCLQCVLARLNGRFATATMFACAVVSVIGFLTFDLTRSIFILFISISLVAFFALWTNHKLDALAPIGNMTYASYLLHFPVQLIVVIVVDIFEISRDVFLKPAALVAFLCVTFLSSGLIYRAFEMPAQKLIRNWLLETSRGRSTS